MKPPEKEYFQLGSTIHHDMTNWVQGPDTYDDTFLRLALAPTGKRGQREVGAVTQLNVGGLGVFDDGLFLFLGKDGERLHWATVQPALEVDQEKNNHVPLLSHIYGNKILMQIYQNT